MVQAGTAAQFWPNNFREVLNLFVMPKENTPDATPGRKSLRRFHLAPCLGVLLRFGRISDQLLSNMLLDDAVVSPKSN